MSQPYGRGCYTFDGMGMQHGHYIHFKEPNQDAEASVHDDEQKDTEKPFLKGFFLNI